MPRARISTMTHRLAEQCREIVHEKARKFGIPPVFVTAHVRTIAADNARHETWRVMVHELGMSRQLVADIFGRDRRRVRESVIGRPVRALFEPPAPVTCHRSRSRPKPRVEPIPFQPVGNQFVWVFALPVMLEPEPIFRRFMRPVPAKVKHSLAADDAVALARFYEREARELRKRVRV